MKLTTLQYVDINRSLCSILTSLDAKSFSTRLLRRNNNQSHDFITVENRDKSLQNLVSEHTGQSSAPLIKAQPIYPSSLLSSEIWVDLSDASKVKVINDSRKNKDRAGQINILGAQTLDIPSDSSLHYRLQSCLPNYLCDTLYRAGLHPVIIINDELNKHKLDTEFIHKIHTLLNKNSTYGTKQVECVVPCFLESDGKSVESLRTHSNEQLIIEVTRLQHYCHRINVIGKASLVLCDSVGILVDALKSSVPAAFVSNIPEGFQSLQNCVTDFTTHGDLNRLLHEQLYELDRLKSAKCHNGLILSNKSTLRDVLSSLIDLTKPPLTAEVIQRQLTSNVDESNDQYDFEYQIPSQDLILHTQQSLCSKANKKIRIKAGLESSRRKFQKFTESPTRFLEDSQITLLRSLAQGKGS